MKCNEKSLDSMRQQILEQINNALHLRPSFFLREQDIQLYLAHHFIRTNLYDNVFVEYHVPGELVPPYLWTDSNNIYIDIVLEKGNHYYPIEIKYKTTTQITPHYIFGQNANVYLGQHGAQNIGCYDFWKDIKRTEFFEETFPLAMRGIVLFVSNDLTYQNAPLNPNTGYAPFSIHQGRQVSANTFLNWDGNLSIANGRPGLTVNHNYNINWTPMNILQHHYILA